MFWSKQALRLTFRPRWIVNVVSGLKIGEPIDPL